METNFVVLFLCLGNVREVIFCKGILILTEWVILGCVLFEPNASMAVKPIPTWASGTSWTLSRFFYFYFL